MGSEAIRVGQAHGYELEDILHLAPETIARAGEGDEAATKAYDAQRFADGKKTASGQRPSMGQDMEKGRRTEIEFINGYIVREGEKLGMTSRANAILTDIVKKVERGELKQDPRHITELRLNWSLRFVACLAACLLQAAVHAQDADKVSLGKSTITWHTAKYTTDANNQFVEKLGSMRKPSSSAPSRLMFSKIAI